MIVSRSLLFALATLALYPLPKVSGQEPETPAISTERPSVGNSPDLLPARSVQVETGLNFAYGSKAYTADLPESLFRFGIGSHTELRFTSANLMHPSDAAAGEPFLQAQDIAFSAKFGLAKPNAIAPQAVILGLGCPTGASEQTSGSYDPSLTLIWQQLVPGGVSLVENVEVVHTSADSARRNVWLPGIGINRAFSPKAGWFVEYAPTVVRDSPTLHIVDAGLTYSPAPSYQFDIRAGYQNDATGLHNLVSVGYSHRINGLGFRRHAALD